MAVGSRSRCLVVGGSGHGLHMTSEIVDHGAPIVGLARCHPRKKRREWCSRPVAAAVRGHSGEGQHGLDLALGQLARADLVGKRVDYFSPVCHALNLPPLGVPMAKDARRKSDPSARAISASQLRRATLKLETCELAWQAQPAKTPAPTLQHSSGARTLNRPWVAGRRGGERRSSHSPLRGGRYTGTCSSSRALEGARTACSAPGMPYW